jgi:beta-galactosidase
MDEANIECHGARELSGKPEWKDSQMDRVQRMAERDKNHPCVVIWSLGNESGGGLGPKSMQQWLHQKHPDRPIHCEYDNGAADMNSAMYAGEGWRGGGGKPCVLCEYTHAMGNSNGNLSEYWHDTIYKTPRHMGGYVWDWVDQGIRQPVPNEHRAKIGSGPVKETFFAYGGWWEDKARVHHDGNFCMNGLVAADRTPHPGLFALKHVYRYVHVQPVDLASGKVEVTNWFDFTNVKEAVDGTWSIVADGEQVATGPIEPIDLLPHAKKEMVLKLPKVKAEKGKEYFLNLRFAAREGYSPLVKAGHELSCEQFPLPLENEPAESLSSSSLPPVKLSQTPQEVTVAGKDFKVRFDAKLGTLVELTRSGKSVIVQGPLPEHRRAYTDNDKAPWGQNRDYWAGMGGKLRVTALTATQDGPNKVRVEASHAYPDRKATWQTIYTVFGDGEIQVEVSYKPGEGGPAPLRQGTSLILPAGFENIAWYGRGPRPTYIDRAFEPMGLYTSTVDAEWVDYSRPQENGNKYEVRWAALYDKAGNGLLITGLPAMGIGAGHYAIDEMAKASYSFQMNRSTDVILHVDYRQMGVGGNNSWGAKPLSRYQTGNTAYRFLYRIRPINGGLEEAKKIWRQQVERPEVVEATTKIGGLAVGKKAWASSAEAEKDNTADKANDGDIGTRWCAANGNYPQQWRVDLGAAKKLTKVRISWETDGPYRYMIETSTDDRSWSRAADRTKNATSASVTEDAIDATARYVRVTIEGAPANAWASICEVEVY